MCGFFIISELEWFLKKYKQDIKRYKQLSLFDSKPVSAFTNPFVPVLHKKHGELQIEPFQWTLIPGWSKSKDLKYHTYNARAEDIFIKPTWKNPIRRSRCAVPAKAFVEWYHTEPGKKNTKKFPFKIELKNNENFFFGGIWDYWKQGEEELFSFSLVTVPANKIMAEVHNSKKRMPLILPEDKVEEWIFLESQEGVENLMKPYPSEKMKATSINTDFKKSGDFEKVVYRELEQVYTNLK